MSGQNISISVIGISVLYLWIVCLKTASEEGDIREMNIVKECSRRALFWIIFVLGLLCILINLGFLYLLQETSIRVVNLSQSYARVSELKEFVHQIAMIMDVLRLWFVPISAAVFMIFGLLLWFFMRLSFGRMARKEGLDTLAPARGKSRKKKTQKTAPAEDPKIRQENDQRLFLHIISALQREGRLLDFFAEDLEEYEDEQVGAAVRNIHENCKKTLDKYIVTEAVVGEAEEEGITVPPDFDPAAIKLTGNVMGDPPFTGLVRHRGWRAKRLDLPTLSPTRDAKIIAPAEVEIS